MDSHDVRALDPNHDRPKLDPCRLVNPAGGKYTWGGVMDSDDVRAIDPKDPNYDSEQEASAPAFHSQLGGHIKAYKQAVRGKGIIIQIWQMA